jgi:acyl carrier protein
MSDNIEAKVIKITSETLKIDESKITIDSSFVSDLGTDSLDLVELMMALEAAFDCPIPDEEASKIATVRDAVEYIKQKSA